MAWPFGMGSSGNKSAEQALTEERMKILSNVAIEQVPLPSEGELVEEDAWTISAGPTRAKLDSIGSVPTVTQAMSPTPVVQQAAPASVDTSGLERMLSSRFDMIEDAISLFESKMQSMPKHVADDDDEDDEFDIDASEVGGDRIITASGEVRTVAGTQRLMEHDQAPLVELYEAQALAANPFLIAPEMLGSHESSVGAPTVAALLLDNMTGMAAVSFTQKAIDSGMLTSEEGKQVLAIVQLANPGDSEGALKDHLPHRALLTFSALISSWRAMKNLRGEE
ncbi:MAG: hypothetical protein VW230_01180 [Candidatus Poseidoniales archaeon]